MDMALQSSIVTRETPQGRFYKANRLFMKTKTMKFVIKYRKRRKTKRESSLLMALVGFGLPTSRMYNKLAAFTNTAGSDPVRSKT